MGSPPPTSAATPSTAHTATAPISAVRRVVRQLSAKSATQAVTKIGPPGYSRTRYAARATVTRPVATAGWRRQRTSAPPARANSP